MTKDELAWLLQDIANVSERVRALRHVYPSRDYTLQLTVNRDVRMTFLRGDETGAKK